jgi:hypothetical protein
MRLQQAIRYTLINDIFYAPNHQLVKLILLNDETLYISTGQTDIPEKLVSNITYNLNAYRNKLKIQAITNRIQSVTPVTLDSIHKPSSEAEVDSRSDASIGLADRYRRQLAVSQIHICKQIQQNKMISNRQSLDSQTLEPVWHYLTTINITASQIWQGSVDLLAVMEHVKLHSNLCECSLHKTENHRFFAYFYFSPTKRRSRTANRIFNISLLPQN